MVRRGAGASVGRGRAIAGAAAVPEFRGAGAAWDQPEEHEAFFREMLGDVDEPTAPFGLLMCKATVRRSSRRESNWRWTLARRLRERARVLGVSAASLCHLAWARVLARSLGSGRRGLRDGALRADAGRRRAPTGRWACSSTPCRCGFRWARKGWSGACEAVACAAGRADEA